VPDSKVTMSQRGIPKEIKRPTDMSVDLMFNIPWGFKAHVTKEQPSKFP